MFGIFHNSFASDRDFNTGRARSRSGNELKYKRRRIDQNIGTSLLARNIKDQKEDKQDLRPLLSFTIHFEHKDIIYEILS